MYFLPALNKGEILNFYVEYLFRSQYLHSLMALTATDLDLQKNQKRLDASVMALEALRNVIKNNSGITCASVTVTCHAVSLGRRLCGRPKEWLWLFCLLSAVRRWSQNLTRNWTSQNSRPCWWTQKLEPACCYCKVHASFVAVCRLAG